jgi:hypothetical protein
MAIRLRQPAENGGSHGMALQSRAQLRLPGDKSVNRSRGEQHAELFENLFASPHLHEPMMRQRNLNAY